MDKLPAVSVWESDVTGKGADCQLTAWSRAAVKASAVLWRQTKSAACQQHKLKELYTLLVVN